MLKATSIITTIPLRSRSGQTVSIYEDADDDGDEQGDDNGDAGEDGDGDADHDHDHLDDEHPNQQDKHEESSPIQEQGQRQSNMRTKHPTSASNGSCTPHLTTIITNSPFWPFRSKAVDTPLGNMNTLNILLE